MEKFKRLRLSPALVISVIALFVAIGGISWAAATIGTKDIKNKAITAKKLRKDAVTNTKIQDNAVNSAKIKRSGPERTRAAINALSGRPSSPTGRSPTSRAASR